MKLALFEGPPPRKLSEGPVPQINCKKREFFVAFPRILKPWILETCILKQQSSVTLLSMTWLKSNKCILLDIIHAFWDFDAHRDSHF